MIPFAWNYIPDPTQTPVLTAVQCYINADQNETADFYLPGRPEKISSREAAARLLQVPVLTHAHPFHTAVGNPFSSRQIISVTQHLIEARTKLSKHLSEEALRNIRHVTDFESFNRYDAFPVAPNAPYAAIADHATTACHYFLHCLRRAGFKGPMANYGTSHRPKHIPYGGPPNNRATPAFVPLLLDSRPSELCFLTGYSSGGPGGCLTGAEMLSAIQAQSGKPFWLAIDDYQPSSAELILAAKAADCELLAFWGTVPASVSNNQHRYAGRDEAWCSERDRIRQQELVAAGWSGY